jgi:hypothetical protein
MDQHTIINTNIGLRGNIIQRLRGGSASVLQADVRIKSHRHKDKAQSQTEYQ